MHMRHENGWGCVPFTSCMIDASKPDSAFSRRMPIWSPPPLLQYEADSVFRWLEKLPKSIDKARESEKGCRCSPEEKVTTCVGVGSTASFMVLHFSLSSTTNTARDDGHFSWGLF